MRAGWVVDFITSAEGKELTLNGWIVVKIYDTISLDIGKLPALDRYYDTDPLVNESNIPVATNLKAVCELNKDQVDLFHSREGKDEDDDNCTVAICNNVPFRNKIIVICNNCSILY